MVEMKLMGIANATWRLSMPVLLDHLAFGVVTDVAVGRLGCEAKQGLYSQCGHSQWEQVRPLSQSLGSQYLAFFLWM
jgi:hypothetical protein